MVSALVRSFASVTVTARLSLVRVAFVSLVSFRVASMGFWLGMMFPALAGLSWPAALLTANYLRSVSLDLACPLFLALLIAIIPADFAALGLFAHPKPPAPETFRACG